MTDTGEADPRLAAALASSAGRAEVLAALLDARVFAGIRATSTAEHTTEHGLRAESSAEMAVLLLSTPDGSRALPVFSDLAALKRWNLTARPVPLTGAQACQAALEEQAEALVLDGTVVLDVAEMTALAQGWVPVPGSNLSSRHEETSLRAPSQPVPSGLVVALQEALRGEPVLAARLLESADGLVLGVAGRDPLSPAELAGLAHRVSERLGDALPQEGLALAEVPAKGPGVPVVRRRWLRRRG